MLESNRDLAQRLTNLEHCFSISNNLSRRQSTTWSQLPVQHGSGPRNINNAISIQTNDRASIATITTSIRYFDFERDLEASRVYSRATRDTVDFSFRSSAVGSHAWSTLSDVSLSDISIISVIALPVYPKDITNGHHYQFGMLPEEFPERGSLQTQTSQTPSLVKTTFRDDTRPSTVDGKTSHSGASGKLEILQVAQQAPRSRSRRPWSRKFIQEYKLVVMGGAGVDKSRAPNDNVIHKLIAICLSL